MWWAEGAAGIERGLSYYQAATGPIDAEFDAIEVRAKERTPPHLDIADLTTIVQFKVWPGMRAYKARQLASVSPEEMTAKALRDAYRGDVRSALVTLDALPQVGIPTASAILAAVYPEKFAVIDRYVMSEIGYIATTWLREGRQADEALALLVESLTAWAVESWTSRAPAQPLIPHSSRAFYTRYITSPSLTASPIDRATLRKLCMDSSSSGHNAEFCKSNLICPVDRVGG